MCLTKPNSQYYNSCRIVSTYYGNHANRAVSCLYIRYSFRVESCLAFYSAGWLAGWLPACLGTKSIRVISCLGNSCLFVPYLWTIWGKPCRIVSHQIDFNSCLIVFGPPSQEIVPIRVGSCNINVSCLATDVGYEFMSDHFVPLARNWDAVPDRI